MSAPSPAVAERLSRLVRLFASESEGDADSVRHLEGDSLHQAVTRLERPHLAPFLRTLLVADGTVTMAIQAYFGEAVEVRTLHQSLLQSPGPIRWLKLAALEEVLYREVSLIGASSGRRYANAYSVIKKAAVPEALFAELVCQRVGIGTLLRNVAKGSYRDILKIRLGGFGEVEPSVNRSYCVYLDARPAILVSEVFPVGVYARD